jgi:hypothetical protein
LRSPCAGSTGIQRSRRAARRFPGSYEKEEFLVIDGIGLTPEDGWSTAIGSNMRADDERRRERATTA